MKEKKYLWCGMLGVIILLLPFEWYSSIKIDTNTFSLSGISGVQVMLDDGVRIGAIFVLTVMIQFLSLKCNSLIWAVAAKIIFFICLLTYPMVFYDMREFSLDIMLEFYSIGFYLSSLLIVISTVVDLICNRKMLM